MRVIHFLRLPTVVIAVSLAALPIGCTKGVQAPSESETKPIAGGKEQIKAKLSEIASSGIGGSAVSGMREGLQELKATDAALADELLKELDQLEKLQDTNQIKTLAGKMAAKL